MKKLITTPIYYVNDIPHIGHAYTTIVADMLKKYYTLRGDDVFLLTGTDENGQKIEQAALKKGIDTKRFVDEVSVKFKDVWDSFEIDYDKFNRTTNHEHSLGVQKAFLKMLQKDDIYKGEYSGHYCISCESFFTQSNLVADIYCPDCGRETSIIKEESYFFRLSKYEDKLLKWYKDTNCILPLHKKNEIIKFVESGLQDLSITRTSIKWGIKLPDEINDNKHIIYVWLDALMNYINALGYALDYQNAKEELQNYLYQDPCLSSKMEYFENTTHVVGKDILRFHAIYWPAFLMSLDLPLPKKIYVHGWWTVDGVKMSKSIGNVVNPLDIKKEFGSDIFRYFLLKEISFGQDGDFSKRALINRNNGELSNDLGNLLNRLIGMSGKYFNFDLNQNNDLEHFNEDRNFIDSKIASLDAFLQDAQFNRYLDNLWEIFYFANNLITKNAPWELIKNDSEKCKEFLNLIANILIKSAFLLYPFMPKSAKSIAMALNVDINAQNFVFFIRDCKYKHDFMIQKIDVLFPKIEVLENENAESKAQNQDNEKKDDMKRISKSDFEKIDIRIGTILQASSIKGSDKLLKMQIDLGKLGTKQIVSKIKDHFSENELVNKRVCVLYNLQKVKLMGEISEGMILTCEDGNKLSLVTIEDSNIKNGSQIC